MAPQFFKIATGPKQKYTAVPQIRTTIKVGSCTRQIGFLDKGRDPPHAGCQGLGRADVAIGGGRSGGAHAEGDDQVVVASRLDRRGHGPGKVRVAGDVMVAGHHQGDGVRRFGGDQRRRRRDRRPGIAAFRFDDEAGRAPEGGGLGLSLGQHRLAGDHDRRQGVGDQVEPQQGLLVERAVAQDAQERLGLVGPRRRPEPHAAAAAQDHGLNLHPRLVPQPRGRVERVRGDGRRELGAWRENPVQPGRLSG